VLSEVEALRDKGDPVPLKHAAHRLGRSLKATLELVADGHLPLVPGTMSVSSSPAGSRRMPRP
jgi:hypothetical protein